MKKSKLPEQCIDCQSREKGIFCELQNHELQEVNKYKVANIYKKGQTLFVQGNPTFGIYCISQGNIKVSKIGSDGKESITRIATAGDVIGHRSLFTENHFSATATAIEDSTVCFIDKKYILRAVQEKPSVANQIIAKLSKDMGAAENRIASLNQKNVRERLAELLLLLKESHGTPIENGHTALDIKLTREEMASMIGTATETLIRFMTELKDLDYIEQDGKQVIIKNEEGLLEYAGIGY